MHLKPTHMALRCSPQWASKRDRSSLCFDIQPTAIWSSGQGHDSQLRETRIRVQGRRFCLHGITFCSEGRQCRGTASFLAVCATAMPWHCGIVALWRCGVVALWHCGIRWPGIVALCGLALWHCCRWRLSALRNCGIAALLVSCMRTHKSYAHKSHKRSATPTVTH